MKLSSISYFFSAGSRKSNSKTIYHIHILIFPYILFLLSGFLSQRSLWNFDFPVPWRSYRFSQLLKMYNTKDYLLSLQRLFVFLYTASLNHIRQAWRTRFSCLISIYNCTEEFISISWPTQKNAAQKLIIYTAYFILFNNHYFKSFITSQFPFIELA